MHGATGPPGNSPDRQAERWLNQLRDGTAFQKAEARRELSAIFAARGMTADAIELLAANARAGYRDAEQFETLSRLYRSVGNEYLAASAALEAARLRERGSATPSPNAGQPGAQSAGQHGRQRAYQSSRSGSASRQPPRAGTPPASGPSRSFLPIGPRWERPLRLGGWVLFAGIVVGALAALGTNPLAAFAYAVAAGALGLLLARATGLRKTLRVPSGPLGDGLLVFVALLLFLSGGALLPRTTGSGDPPPVTAPPARTPGPLYLGAPTPAPAAPAAPPTRPAASPQPAPSPAAASGSAPAPVTAAQAPTSAAAAVASPTATSGARASSAGGQSAAAVTRVRIVNAGSEGVRLRPAPGAEDVLKVLAEGDLLESLGEEQEDGGRTWRRVREQDGLEGWVAADFLAIVPVTPTVVVVVPATPTAAPPSPTRQPTVVAAAIVPPTPAPIASRQPQAPAPATAPATAVGKPQAAPQATPAPKPPAPAPAAQAAPKVAPSGFNCPATHPIKGNHSSSGEWIYHPPGGQYYSRTRPEDCFATAEDARRAGYRPSQR